MQLTVRLECVAPACMAAVLTACADIPGHFYHVQVPEPQPNTVCMDLARELSSQLPLQIVDQTFPVRPKGACIVDLDYQGHSPPRAPVDLLYDPPSHLVGIRVALQGPSNTQELASQIASIVAARFPGATVTEIHPKQSFAP